MVLPDKISLDMSLLNTTTVLRKHINSQTHSLVEEHEHMKRRDVVHNALLALAPVYPFLP